MSEPLLKQLEAQSKQQAQIESDKKKTMTEIAEAKPSTASLAVSSIEECYKVKDKPSEELADSLAVVQTLYYDGKQVDQSWKKSKDMLKKISAKDDSKAVAKELNELSTKKRISEKALDQAEEQVENIKVKTYSPKTNSNGAANFVNWSEHVIYHQRLLNNLDAQDYYINDTKQNIKKTEA